MLRASILGVAAILAITAVLQVAMGHPYGWLPVGLEAVLIVIAIVFERGRYRPTIRAGRGTWTRTGERFRDPESGEVLDVYVEATTGQRDYRPAP